jgi:hypothetical protein
VVLQAGALGVALASIQLQRNVVNIWIALSVTVGGVLFLGLATLSLIVFQGFQRRQARELAQALRA